MDPDCCTADFSILPAHIITQILKYLELGDFKNASTVCKSWHYASTDPQIVRTLILQPKEDNFTEICQSNRRYGVLRLFYLKFDKADSYYFELFETFGPFVYEITITNSDLKIHHLLKLFEYTTCLEIFSFFDIYRFAGHLSGLFPLDYDCEAKYRIIKNLSSVKKIVFTQFKNIIPTIRDLMRFATNLDSLRISNEFAYGFKGNVYDQLFTIFENDNIGNLRHFDFYSIRYGWADEFITSFVNIKNLNLRSFRLVIKWNWEDRVYKGSLFSQFVLKLRNLKEFTTDKLTPNQLTLICEHLVNLKSFHFKLDNNQPISALTNLRQLSKLCCRSNGNMNLVGTDEFFQHKFEYLRQLEFGGVVTESNLLKLCENHPNLIELKLPRVVTPNVEIIFKHLTKLRVLRRYYRPVSRDSVNDVPLFDTNREHEFKISRLHDLETCYIGRAAKNGIHEDDIRQLEKLRNTDLEENFKKNPN